MLIISNVKEQELNTYHMSDFDEYQERAYDTAVYPYKGANFTYPALGLAGESGEVCEKIKKIIRDEEGLISAARAEEVAYELSDVLWYIAALASEIGYNLSEIALMNLDKLKDRKERGVLGGSGDNR